MSFINVALGRALFGQQICREICKILAIFNRLVSPGLSLIIPSVSAFGDGADD